MSSKRLLFVGAGLVMLAVGCGIAVQRDLSTIPPGQVGFDDMCGLQGYFDALEINTSPPPRVVSALDLEGQNGGRAVRGGTERFAFETPFQLQSLKRVLSENWKRLPDPIANASEIEIEVHWSEKAGTKRVLTDQAAELAVGQESWDLPYQPCLSELLYGQALYRQRRLMWGLPLPGQPPDGGAPDAAPAAAPAPPAPAKPADG
ncbi:MAG TPA: hypothetical protein VHG72_11450, partial [Polyangia bacterium]|nr:hypothetical protein [Polyangia bacterium]